MRDRRMPLQGGLPPVDAVDAAVVQIACDESGFSGTNLLDPSTPVFTHASVDLRLDEAGELIRALRSGSRRRLHELKSAQFLRGAHAHEALTAFLTALDGRAHVHVVDKELFLVSRIVDLFLVDTSYAAGTRLAAESRPAALALYRGGPAGGRDWRVFLESFTDLVRTRGRRPSDRRPTQAFFRARDSLADRGLGAEAEAVLDGLTRARVRAVLTRLADDDPSIPPPLEPLLPALAETVMFWSGGRRQVLVIHDEQSALTARRLRRLQEALSGPAGVPAGPDGPDGPRGRVSPLAGLVTVDSRDDPRVQVADLLAGVARRAALGGVQLDLEPLLSRTSLRDPERAARTSPTEAESG